MESSLTRIGLVIPHDLAYCRGILRGIKRFAVARPHWVFMEVAPVSHALKRLSTLKLSGLIAHIFSDALAEPLLALGKPLVNVFGRPANAGRAAGAE